MTVRSAVKGGAVVLVAVCGAAACSSAGEEEPVAAQAAAAVATSLSDFLPEPTTTTSAPSMSQAVEPVPLDAQVNSSWTCGFFNVPTTGDFQSCLYGLGMPAVSGYEGGVRNRAQAYLRYILGGDTDLSANQGMYWTDTSRRTRDRLCWLREAVKAGTVKVRPFGTHSICGFTARAMLFSGTISTATGAYPACAAPTADNSNPALHIARISRTMRAELDACFSDDTIPTFFQISKWLGSGDTQALVDPEAGVISADWAGTAASAAATGQDTGAAMTAYRFGSTYLAASGRSAWIGNPCVNSTTTVTKGSVASNFVLVANPPSNTYLMCGACGASGQTCCPNSAGTPATCNTGLTCTTGKCR